MRIRKDLSIFSLIFLVVLASRYYLRSFGYDQYDVVDYFRSLRELTFYRPAPWPVLLAIQRFLLPLVGPQQALVIPSVLFGSLFVALTYPIGMLLTRNRVLSVAAAAVIAANPVVWVYSEIGMTDITQTFFAEVVLLLSLIAIHKQNKIYIKYAYLWLGLTLGVKTIHIIALPAVLFAQYLVMEDENRRISFASIATHCTRNFKAIVKEWVWLAIGVALWQIPSSLLFEKPEGGSDLEFFIYQVTNFGILGIDWKTKLTLIFSYFGYHEKLLYLLNYLLLAYLYLGTIADYIRKKTSRELASISVLGILIWSFTFFYLRILSKTFPPYILFLFSVPLASFSVQQARTLVKKRSPLSAKNRLTANLIRLSLIYVLIYASFFFTFAGSVPRYFLPIYPPLAILLLFPLFSLAKKETNKIAKLAKSALLSLTIGSVFVMNFQPAITLAKSFHQNIDTRTAVAHLLRDLSHEEQNGIAVLDLTPFGVAIHKYLELVDTAKISIHNSISPIVLDEIEGTQKALFILTYGEASPPDCAKQELEVIERFRRVEGVIEDSVGNVGFDLYLLKYKNLGRECTCSF